MLRTEIFNVVAHRSKRVSSAIERSQAERKLLNGRADAQERKLLQRSPLVKELILGEHDHRMFGIGIAQFEP